MLVVFEKEYLKDLYVSGRCYDKGHRYQPHIISKYARIIKLMCAQDDVLSLMKYSSLHYEKLKGDKEGLSSIRINKQYRIEFEEIIENGKTKATICNIVSLSNHYK